MILVIEPICHDSEHIPINTSVLEIISYAYPRESIAFYGERHHVDNLKDMFDNAIGRRFTWKKIRIPGRHQGFFKRISGDFFLIYKIIKESKSTDTISRILFTAASPSVIWVLKILILLKIADCQTQIVLHGGLASLGGWRSRNPFLRIQDQSTALSFFNWKSMQYIVLENAIKKNLTKIMPKLNGRVCALDHPFPHSQGYSNCLSLAKPFKFVYIGVAAERKGFSSFLDTAEKIKEEYREEAEFHALGRLPATYKNRLDAKMKVLNTRPSDSILGREEFIKRLKTMHFVCLFFDEKYYRLSASGVLLDAIAFEKPIISSDLQLFRDIEREFGDIGYICNSQNYVEAVQSIIESGDKRRYRLQTNNLKKLKAARLPQNLAQKYRHLSEELN